ncbi:hypothetical protein BG003_005815 [Podila horticola]|nr:hypothetical protein BG003_005815 [Podila horticola]
MSSFDPSKPTEATIRSSLANSDDLRQDTTAYALEPPTYDEAIGFASDPATAIQRNVRPVPCDELQGAEVYDMEDEQDYEESRPLRTGVVPSTSSQYTFIQPQDHTRQKWWRQSKSHSQKYHYHKSTQQSFSGYNRQSHHCQTPVQTLGERHQAFTGAPPTMSASGPSTNGPYTPPSLCPQPYAAASGTHTPTALEDLPPVEAKPSLVDPSAPPGINIPAISHSTSYAPPNGPPPSLPQQLPTYQRPAEPFAGIPAVHENQGLMNAQDISIADFVRKASGDESVDPILENDPYQLYRYFVAHNDRPEMYLLITGYHVEQRETVSTDSKGNRTTSQAVQWDYEELTRAIIHAVRSTHYRFNVEVSFPLKNDRVKVASSSPLAKFMRNPWTKAFCFLGVVGVVFYPIRECYKRVRKESIKSNFEMTLSTREFYQANYWSIVDQVRYK